MSADRDGLFQAILTNPDDDLPRLVYADWLEEHGDPEYARFIRTQLQLAQVPDYHPLHVRLWWEERGLVTGLPFRSRLSGVPEALALSFQDYRRGFPWQVGAQSLPDFIVAAPELFALVPLQALSLRAEYRAPPPDLSPLADSPWLARLRRLEINLARLPAREIQKLQQSPHADNLVDLAFKHAGIEPDGLVALLEPPLVGQLEALTLYAIDIRLPDLLRAIQGPGEPHQLRSLEYVPSLHLTRLPPLTSLFQAPWLQGITALRLANMNLGPERVVELVNSPLPGNLESLQLNNTKPGVPGVRALAGCAALSGLRRLHLALNSLGPVAMKALAQSPHLGNLWVLDLTNNPIGDNGAIALAESPYPTNLVHLELMHCDIGDAGAEALLESPITQGLVHFAVYSSRRNGLSAGIKQRLRDRFGKRVFV
jgi:uncharacterized protein (TIGR02996 family)